MIRRKRYPPQGVCPLCGQKSKGEIFCPFCGHLLIEVPPVPEIPDSDFLAQVQEQWQEVPLPPPAEVPDSLAQVQEQWQEASTHFQEDKLGSDESTLISPRSQLEQIGFQPGTIFEAQACRHHSSLFGGTAFLGVQVHGLPIDQEAESTLNGHLVGITQEGYFALQGLRAGRYRLEASTSTLFAATEIELSEGRPLRVDLNLQVGRGLIRVLSFVGGVTVEIGKRSIPAPCETEVEAGAHTVILKWKGQTLPLSVMVRREEMVEINVSRLEPFVPLWVRHTSTVRKVAFSPDGQWVASGSSDSTVRLWDVSSGQCMWVGRGHTSMVRSVVFSPDGKWLASGSEDNTVRLWDVSSGQCIWVGKGHKGTVENVASQFSPKLGA